MPKLYRLSGREVVYFLEKLGFAQVRQRGSHVGKSGDSILNSLHFPKFRSCARSSKISTISLQLFFSRFSSQVLIGSNC